MLRLKNIMKVAAVIVGGFGFSSIAQAQGMSCWYGPEGQLSGQDWCSGDTLAPPCNQNGSTCSVGSAGVCRSAGNDDYSFFMIIERDSSAGCAKQYSEVARAGDGRPSSRGFELFWDGVKVNGPDAESYSETQAREACELNLRVGIEVLCRFNGVSFYQSAGEGVIAGNGFELFWDGVKVNGTDAESYSETQAREACGLNLRPGIKVECRFNGITFYQE